FEHTKDGAPVLKRDGASNSSIAGLEELTAGEEESQTRNSNTSSGSRGRLLDVEEGALPNSLAAFGSGKGTRRTDGFGVPMDGFTRRSGVDEETASRDRHGELGDYSTDSDDSDDSDTDAKGDRRMSSHGQDSMTMAQSSTVDPTRSQLRVVVSRQSNNNLSGYTSKDSCRGATTPISTNGTVGRQQGGQLTKAVATTMATTATAMSGVDWNRNGSSSALNGGDITPGVARATIRPSGASMYGHGNGSVTPRESTDEIEIETRFGPMRLNECKGFNLGGLSLTGTSPLTPSPSQTRYAFGSVCRGSAIPERSTIYGVSTPSPTRGGGSGEAFSAFRSPATMQAASPSPVFFSHSHHHHHYGSNMGRRESVAEDSNLDKRSKEQPSSIKKSSPSSPHKMTRTLKSRHSTSSLSSLSSSSSSSSLASFYEGGEQQRSTGTTMGFVHGEGAGVRSSSSTWSYGLTDSPLRGEYSGGESLAGPTSRSTTTRHCSKKEKSTSTNNANAGGREHKKRRKEYSQAATTSSSSRRYDSPLQSKSEVILTRPLFGLGSASNMSSSSLSLASAESTKDVKGKHVDPFTSSSSLSSSNWPAEGDSTTNSTPTTTTTAFNMTMTPFQLPMPAYFSQGLSSKLDLDDAIAGFPSSSLTTATATGTSTSSRKQPQRNGSLRHTLRSSVSSPSLLTSHRDARSAVAVSSGLPVRPQLASHSDLPPKSGSVDPSLASLSTSSSPCGSTTAIRKSGAREEEEEGDSGLIGTRLLTGGSIGHLSQLTQQQQQQMEATSDSSGNSNGAHASATMSVNSAFVRSLSEPQGSASALVNTVSHFTGHSSFTTTDSSYPTNTITSSSVSAARVSAEYPFTRHPSSSSGTNPSTQAAPLPLRPILSTSVHLQSQHSLVASSTTTTPVTPTPYTTTAVSCGISPLSSILSPTHPSTPTMTTPLTTTTTTSNMMPTTTTMTTTTTTSASTSTTTPQYYTHPTSTFFTSPITSSCTTTMPDSGIQVLGPTITMIMKDNRRLVLRRSAPLILNEGVGEERAARM
ncbi:hypothetical protein BGX23_002020, partial [Mortierella sp. AD031]